MEKRFLAFLLSAIMLVGTMTGCGSTNAAGASGDENINAGSKATTENNADVEIPSAITVSTAYGDVEVPYAPERICVLDLSTMDIVDSLGLGDKVVCLAWHKHYPDYLEEYYVSETIISLTSDRNNNKGQSEEISSTEEVTDPYEIYYGIDADLIIGTTEKIDKDLYAVLSQIAPTVALEPALESTDNIYSGMRTNAAVVASIWGMDDEFETKMATYDEMYTQLCETVNGKIYVMTSGNTDLNSIQIGSSSKSNESSNNTGEKNEVSTEKTDYVDKKSETSTEKTESSLGEQKKKDNTANVITFLTQIGMTNVTETVSPDVASDVISAAVEAGTSQEDAANMVINAVNSVNPDAVFVFNYKYNNLDEIRAEGFDLLNIENLNANVCFISIELTYTTGGLTAVTSTMDQLAEAFLN